MLPYATPSNTTRSTGFRPAAQQTKRTINRKEPAVPQEQTAQVTTAKALESEELVPPAEAHAAHVSPQEGGNPSGPQC